MLPLLPCSELMAGSNIPSKSELIEYTQQHPVWASASERLQVRGVCVVCPNGLGCWGALLR